MYKTNSNFEVTGYKIPEHLWERARVLCDAAIERMASIKYADLLNDVGFKIVFGRDANKDILIEFLNHIIPDRKIVDLEYMDKEQTGDDLNSKRSIFDVYCKTDDNSWIVVEIQREPQKSFVERTLYYSTFHIRNQVEAGRHEYSFCPIYVVSILEFCLPINKDNDEILTCFRLSECKSHSLMTDKLTFIFIELPKFKKSLEELDGSVLDGFYFCLKNMQTLRKKPAELQQQVFTRLFEVAQLAKMSESERNKIVKDMRTERDLRNQFAYATETGWNNGWNDGMEKGMEEKARMIASRLSALGMSKEQIADATGLSIEEVGKL